MLSIYTEEPREPAQACVIWLHGLGSNGADMHGVVQAFPPLSLPIRHVFVDAPVRPVTLNNRMQMQAWYDITGLTLQDREDRDGILQSERALDEIIAAQITQGIAVQHIFLAGFSQGGAMALFVGLRTRRQLGGIVALSAYLPLQKECLSDEHVMLPIFMAMGTADQVVLPAWTKISRDFISSRGFTRVTWNEYPIGHTICMEEITDIAVWLKTQIGRAVSQGETI